MSQQINLLNQNLLTTRELIDARMMLSLAGIVGLLALLSYGLTSYRATQLAHEQQAVTLMLTSLKQQLDQSMQQHTPRVPSKGLQDDVVSAQATLRDCQQVLTFLQGGGGGNTKGFSSYMEAFSRQGMKGLWLTGFSIDDSVRKIGISGRALRADLVPQYISGLRQEPILKGRQFAALEMSLVVQSPLAANSSEAMPKVITATAATKNDTIALSENVKPIEVAASIAIHDITQPNLVEFKLQSQEREVATDTNKLAPAGGEP